MRERRYESRGHEVVVREGDDAVELELDGIPIDIEYIDGAYHSQTAHSFRSFPTIDAVVEELLRNEGRLWSLHGDVRGPMAPGHPHEGHQQHDDAGRDEHGGRGR
jgi:hypothetical protein